MIERAVEYILSMGDETIGNLTAADVAAKVEKNLRFFSLVFVIVQKISIANFIHREKLHRAYYILENDYDISILKLAENLGFTEAEVFEAEFEKYYAITPVKFQDLREKNRDSDETKYKPRKNNFKRLDEFFEQRRDIV